MLLVSRVNFNSKNNQKPIIRTNSQSIIFKKNNMADSVSFGNATEVIRPAAEDIIEYAGHGFINGGGVISHSIKLYSPKEASAVIDEINSVSKRLSSYDATEFHKFLRDTVLNGEKSVYAKNTTGMELEDYGKYEKYLKELYSDAENQGKFGIEVIKRKNPLLIPIHSEMGTYPNNRVSESIAQHIKDNVLGNTMFVNVNGQNYYLSSLSNSRGIELKRLTEITH